MVDCHCNNSESGSDRGQFETVAVIGERLKDVEHGELFLIYIPSFAGRHGLAFSSRTLGWFF